MLCANCGHIWTYNGNSKYYATCPICHYKVRIPEILGGMPRLQRKRGLL